MGFVDLFRKKWKHSDAEVRAAAVRELAPTDVEVLEGIAQSDKDAGVRRVAIKKLEDPTILARIAREDPDESLRQIAAEKASGILIGAAVSDGVEQDCQLALEQITDERALAEVAKTASHKAVRSGAVARLTDEKALADVARNAKEAQVRIDALRLIVDIAVLRSVALNDDRKEVCLAALERMGTLGDETDRGDEREALDAVARKAKNKTVRAQARRQLAALGGARPESKKKQSQWQQICEMVEVLSRSSDWERTGQKIEQAQTEWEAMEGEPDPELQRRFKTAAETFFARVAEHRERQAERQQKERELQQVLAGRMALCEEVEALEGDDVEQRVAELRQRWEQMPPIPAAHRDVIEQRFQRGCETCLTRKERQAERQDAQERMERLCQQAERLLGGPKPRRALKRYQVLEEEWRGVAAGEGADSLRERFSRVGEELRRQQEEEEARREQNKHENKQRLESLCERLEAAAGSDNLKSAERLLRDAQSSFKRLSDLPSKDEREALGARYTAAREMLFTRVQELREADEWKRWAVVPKLEALCERVEKLAEEQSLKRVSQELRKAQAAWKKVGPAPRDKAEALWQRFKQASDVAYGRCQEYFAELEQQRGENLKKKLELCEQAEQLAAAELGDDRAQWEETASKLKELQAQWKQAGPVPKAQSDAIWARFRKACDQFFDKRQQKVDEASGERQENLARKQSLCEEAEQLAGAELGEDKAPWEETANKLKELQVRWKKIGAVPRAQSDAIWARFRKACDQFFDRRQQQADKEREANRALKEGLCERLDALLAGAGEEPVRDAVLAIRAEWRQVGPVPEADAEALWTRFCRACEQAVTAQPDQFEGTELDPAANQKKQDRLVQRVEELADLHAPAKTEETPAGAAAGSVEQMAEQLRDALAKNALRDTASAAEPDLQATIREVKRLQGQWRKVGPVPGEEGQELSRRFRAACDRIFALRQPVAPAEAAPPDEEGSEENLARKEALCERAEELASSETPAEHREEIRELRRQWKAIGPVPKSKARRLWNRFRRACNRVMAESKQDAESGQEEQVSPAAERAAPEAEPNAATVAEAPAAAGWDPSLDSGWDDVLGDEEDGQRQEEG